MRTGQLTGREWAAEHPFAVSAILVVVAGLVGSWQMLTAGDFSFSGDPNNGIPWTLFALAITCGSAVVALAGRGRTIRWRAVTFVIVGLATFWAWVPTVAIFLLMAVKLSGGVT